MRPARAAARKSGLADPTLKPKRRKPSSPKRDAVRTRARILDTAISEFAKKGYSGARIDAICRAARVNPRMIYHYFPDKAGLYIEVLERVLSDLRAEELELDVDQVPPDTAAMQLFEFIHGHFGEHPELMSLLSGENLLQAEFLRRSRNVQIISSPLIGLIERLLRRGEADGCFRPGIDALHLYVIMVALSYFHRSNAYTLSVIFATDLLEPRWQAKHKLIAFALLEAYLAPTKITGTHRRPSARAVA